MENTVLGGVMILVVAVLRRILRGRISPNVTLLLWAVCLARLMTPVGWSSGLSFYAIPALLGKHDRGGAVRVPEVNVPPEDMGTGSCTGLAVLVYLAVGLALAALFAAAWFSTRRRVRSVAAVAESDPRRATLPAGTDLREGDMRGAPLTFGALRPSVVLTPGLGERELHWVLAHESVHVRRRDNLWHYLMSAALAVHWFNPAVWLMAGLLRRDVELSCDRAVLCRMGADCRAEYANTLITLSTKTESPAFCRGFGPKRAEERIVAIMKFKKTTFCGLLAALVLTMGTTVAFATSPTGTEGPVKSPSDSPDVGVTSGTEDQGERFVIIPEEPENDNAPSEETLRRAYLNLDTLSPEQREEVLKARNEVIYNHSWVADGYEGFTGNVLTGETEKLPSFHELFPEDWEIPTVDPVEPGAIKLKENFA